MKKKNFIGFLFLSVCSAFVMAENIGMVLAGGGAKGAYQIGV